jgi:hypothetical protein
MGRRCMVISSGFEMEEEEGEEERGRRGKPQAQTMTQAYKIELRAPPGAKPVTEKPQKE